jgi:Cache domain
MSGNCCGGLCNFDWNQYTIQKRLTIQFGSVVLVCKILLYICILVYAIVLSDNIIELFKETLTTKTTKNLQSLASDNALLASILFNKTTNGFMLPYRYSTEIAHESNFNLDDMPGYFDDGTDTYLAKPLTHDSRYGKSVSLKASSWTLAYLTATNETNIPASMENHINKTMHSDQFIKPSFTNYKNDFVAGYTGFDDGLFMTFPGVSTGDTDPGRRYDPRQRDWYKSAISYGDIIYTNPYKDFNGKGWMITMAQPLKLNGIVKGVVGSDMLISTINNLISQVNIYDSGKATLLTIDGNVVADKEWNPTPTSNGISYSDLSSPPISSSTWSEISSITDEKLMRFSGYFVYVKKIRLSNNNLILLLSVPESAVFESLREAEEKIKKQRDETIGIITAFTITVIIIVTVFTYLFGKQLSKNIEELCDNAKGIMVHLGHTKNNDTESKMYDTVKPVTESDIAEMNQINNGFYAAINRLKNAPKEIQQKNPFLGRAAEILMLDTLNI